MTAFTINDIISNGERTILFTAVSRHKQFACLGMQLYTWNQASTLQCFECSDIAGGVVVFEETDIRTFTSETETPKTEQEALTAIKAWHEERLGKAG
jgi:hypothetical protein